MPSSHQSGRVLADLVARAARGAKALATGCVVAWLALSALAVLPQLATGAADGLAALFVLGSYGLFFVFLLALFSLPAGFATSRLRLLGASSWDPVVLGLGSAVLGGYLTSSLSGLLAETLLPDGLDLRPVFVEASSTAISVAVGALAGTTVLVLFQGGLRPFPLWLFGLALLVFRALAFDQLAVIFVERYLWLEATSAVFVFACFFGFNRFQEHASVRAATAAGIVLLALSVFALVSGLGSFHGSRAAAFQSYPGPLSFVRAVRSVFDLDGDGFASILGGMDCDDGDAARSLYGLEIVGNGVDDNCQGGDLASFDLQVPRSRSRPSAPSSIVFITIDALRADSLRARDSNGDPVMSNLVRYAKKGALFPNTYAQAPFTDLSFRSFITGRYPMDFYNFGGRYLGQEPTLPERLVESGYRTACLQQVWLLNPLAHRGCQHYDDSLARENAGFRGRTSGKMTDLAIAELEKLMSSASPFFLWVHYFDPHSRYLPHPEAPLSDDSAMGRYLQELWFTDREVGRLIETIEGSGFGGTNFVVIVGDHGELLGEGNRMGHGYWLDERVIKVPLIIRGEAVRQGVFPNRVQLVDIFPTMLEVAAGKAAPSDGMNLESVWQGREQGDRDVFSITPYYGVDKRAVIKGSWKYVLDANDGAEYLYRLDTPDGERRNVIDANGGKADELRELLGRRFDLSMNDVVMKRKLERLPERLDAMNEMLEWQERVKERR